MEKINLKYLNWYIGVLILCTMIPLINGTFGVDDDFLFYQGYHLTDYWQESAKTARETGRFFQLFIMPIFSKWLPYCFGNLFIASAINILLFAVDFILLSYFLFQLTKNTYLKYFILIFLIIAVNIHGHYNPLVSYPIYFSFSILLMLVSFILIKRYQTSASARDLGLSVFCFLFSLLFCEMHIFYLLIIALINNDYKFELKMNSITKNRNFYFVLVTGMYIVIYVLWSVLFSSNEYRGNRIDADISIIKVLSTVFSFSKSSAPLYFFFSDRDMFVHNSYIQSGHVQNLFYPIMYAKIDWLVKGLTVSVTAFFVLQHIQALDLKKLSKILLISFCFIFIPNILISVTPKYIEWGVWENYYVYTFYSFLSLIVFLSLLIVMPLNVLKNNGRIVYIGVVSALCFIITVVNSYINYHSLHAIKKSENNLKAIAAFIKTDSFRSLKENTCIFTPDLLKGHSDVLYFKWDKKSLKEYVKIHSGKNIIFADTIEQIPAGPVYYCGYCADNKSGEDYITFSKLIYLKKDTVRTDEMTLFVNSVNKDYTISLNKYSEKPWLINDSVFAGEKDVRVHIQQMNKNMNRVQVKIKSENIDPNSLIFSSMNTNDKTVHLVYIK